MLKELLRTFLRELGYTVARLPQATTTPPVAQSPRLQTLRVELFPGWPVELDLGDACQRHALRMGDAYEAPCLQLLRTFCATPGCMFFDVGANFGIFSHYLLSQCPALAVHSFEPNLHHVTRHRHAAAALAPDRFFPHQLALSDAAGELDLVVSTIDSGWSTFGPNPDFAGQEATLRRQRVSTVRFDEWRETEKIALPPEPAWVAKIDVEGFEPRVVRGMSAALEAHAFKAVLVEVLDHTLNFCGTNAGEVFRLFAAAGYAPFDVNLEPTVPLPKEERNVLFLPVAR